MTDAIAEEIMLRHSYLDTDTLQTIYFGGGTPSVLPVKNVYALLNRINRYYRMEPGAEITLEANPDDLTKEKLRELKDAGITRLSIGVQSFFNEDLKWMNRAHNASDAHRCIEDALAMDFLLTIDLIFGAQTTTSDMWQKNLETANSFGIQHLSCYSLTLEDKTALQKLVQKGRYEAPQEGKSAEQFAMAMDYLEDQGWQQYEISNYCRNGAYAIHNTNYWKNRPYLGVGPSAHSFNGSERSWNIADNKQYIESLHKHQVPMETEYLTPANRFNEYLMTGLRTIWGVSLPQLFAIHAPGEMFEKTAGALVAKGYIIHTGDTLYLTREGKFYADAIASDLFL